jgi:hypothetical protein
MVTWLPGMMVFIFSSFRLSQISIGMGICEVPGKNHCGHGIRTVGIKDSF